MISDKLNQISHSLDVRNGNRFKFGDNWVQFLSVLDDTRIEQAVLSLSSMLAVKDLHGKSFCDAGSGSGLFSLAAKILGASVTSFDYDPLSVACTQELRNRYFPDDQSWVVVEGSVLDQEFLTTLGTFDIVYSWGVLHHTGQMWQALENVLLLSKDSSCLYIAIYNDQGFMSSIWKLIKKVYCTGFLGRILIKFLFFPYFILGLAIHDLFNQRSPLSRYSGHYKKRGMSIMHDLVDWLGGYPFEVAKPEDIFSFYHSRGLLLEGLKTCAGKLGCNEFIFSINRSSVL